MAIKYISLLMLSFISILSPVSHAQDKLKVATTFTIIADIAQNVAGDVADVVSITKYGAEIHQYQPTPKDIVKAQDADLILYNGMNLELWFDKFFNHLKDVPRVIVTTGIEPISVVEGDYQGKPNPHAWMSPNDVLIYIDNIAHAMIEKDSKNKEIYLQNAAEYKEKIKILRSDLENQIKKIPEQKRWLVTSEGAFSYFARDFNLKELYLWPINADQQGTPKQIKKVIDQIIEHQIPVIFSESTVSADPAKQIAKETNIHYGGVLYVDSLSEENGTVPTYLALLNITGETIINGFLNNK